MFKSQLVFFFGTICSGKTWAADERCKFLNLKSTRIVQQFMECMDEYDVLILSTGSLNQIPRQINVNRFIAELLEKGKNVFVEVQLPDGQNRINYTHDDFYKGSITSFLCVEHNFKFWQTEIDIYRVKKNVEEGILNDGQSIEEHLMEMIDLERQWRIGMING